MTYECRYLVQGRCTRRDKSCDPGDKGCILWGQYSFPFKEDPAEPAKGKPSRKAKKQPPTANSC